MKYIIVLLMIIAPPAYAKEAWYLEGSYLTLHTIDYFQTMQLADKHNIEETNLILGKRPTALQIQSYFLATAVMHVYVSATLPPKWRRIWQISTSIMEAKVIGNNVALGLRLSF